MASGPGQRIIVMRRFLLILVALGGLWIVGPALSQQPAQPTPEELRSLAALLRDPAIQAWLESAAEGAPPADPAAASEGPAEPRHPLARELDAMRDFLHSLVVAVPTLPAEFGHAWTTLSADLGTRGVFGTLALLAVFAVLGFGIEWLFWWATAGLRQRMVAFSLESPNDRLRAVATRGAYGLGVLLAFAIGSIGAFLLFDWPPMLRHVVLTYLSLFLIVRLVLVFGRILLAPGAERFRVVPMATPAARFWFAWSAVLIGWYFFVSFTLDVLAVLGVGRAAGYVVGLTCGVVLLGLALWVVWRHPERNGTAPASHRNRLGAWTLSVYLVVVWLLLFTGSTTPFFIGVILLLLPITLRNSHLAVAHVLRPADREAATDTLPSLVAVMVERGLRAGLLIGGAYLIAWVLDIDFVSMTMQDTTATRLVRGAINAVVILLVADLAWHLARAWFDRRLAEASAGGEVTTEDVRRQARLRTLLPILKNVLLVLLVVMAVLMALSALGIEVGPLIAGAGVVGVAIGFGAQTLVKDIISGMFYLLDDAFRVGEYIISGEHKGTVESFSLRSIKLPPHPGDLFTVPFGELGAVQNMSRDWVIDKLTVSVTYDTDLDKVKPIIKQIGKELQADPEFAPHIIETLKLQGVEQFGDFAIQMRLKMMTKPGEQFVIRRKAYAMIKKAFAANGIEFAFPTVQVAGGHESTAAAAQQALALTAPQPAAE